MRYKLIVSGLGIAALVASAGCQALQPPSGARAPGNAVVTVAEDDQWHMTPNTTTAPAGKVSFVVTNKGKLDHEMVLLKTDKAAGALAVESSDKVDEEAAGENVGEIEAEAGTTAAATFNLAPGHYVMICNIPAHYKAGMLADFTVTGTAPAQTAEKPAAAKAPAAAKPAGRQDIALVAGVRPTLTKLLDDLNKGDVAAARKDLAAYDSAWNGIEVYVNVRSTDLYGQLETDIQARLTKALNDPQAKPADIIPVAQAMLAKYDEAINLVQASPAISPLFDDLATLRILRTATIRNIDTQLKNGDVAAAKASFAEFMNRWSDVEDLVKAYSVDAYAGTESAMAKANTAFQKTDPDAAELRPLAADVLAQYNVGVSLVNAAARNADPTKTTYTNDDVQLAAGAAAIQAELNASLPLWRTGKYREAADRAQRASGELFANISGALKAKNGADAALKKALDAYVPVAGAAGDATKVQAAQTAAVQAAAVAQQALVGQFWTDPEFQDAIRQAPSTR